MMDINMHFVLAVCLFTAGVSILYAFWPSKSKEE